MHASSKCALLLLRYCGTALMRCHVECVRCLISNAGFSKTNYSLTSAQDVCPPKQVNWTGHQLLPGRHQSVTIHLVNAFKSEQGAMEEQFWLGQQHRQSD